MPTVATPSLLTDPGYLFKAPLGTALPTMTVAASKFSVAWDAAWIPCGATEDGHEFGYEAKLKELKVAEFFDPVKWVTEERSGSFSFALADFTLKRWEFALNGGTTTTVAGTGVTLASKYVPPNPGTETRVMLGWESEDNTIRIIVPQAINGANVKSEFKRSEFANIACEFQFEVPASGDPFELYGAGTTRLGV